MFKLLDTVVLDRDLPEHGLRRGDLGAVVDIHPPSSLDVEFVLASGKTQALVTLDATDLRAVGDGDLIAVRDMKHCVSGQAATRHAGIRSCAGIPSFSPTRWSQLSSSRSGT